jgi:hypothetical protein
MQKISFMATKFVLGFLHVYFFFGYVAKPRFR